MSAIGGHFINLDSISEYATSRGVPHARVMVICTGILILLGGLGIVLGFWVRFAILLLLIFLIPVTFKMHSFWNDLDPMQRMSNQVNFNKNIALIGASLAYLFISLPWPLAIQ